jgi:type II secretory pathway component PulC
MFPANSKFVGFFLMSVFLISTYTEYCKAQNDDMPDVMTLTDNIPPNKKGKAELVLRDVKKNSVYEKIGLKTGDAIKEWNGKKVTKGQDWAFIEKSLETTSSFNVVIERAGKEKVLRYPAKQ